MLWQIAIMGCIVNGPGEMADADFGYVGGAPGKIDPQFSWIQLTTTGRTHIEVANLAEPNSNQTFKPNGTKSLTK